MWPSEREVPVDGGRRKHFGEVDLESLDVLGLHAVCWLTGPPVQQPTHPLGVMTERSLVGLRIGRVTRPPGGIGDTTEANADFLPRTGAGCRRGALVRGLGD